MDLVLFLTFALIAVACALNMALQRHPVSSALSLIGVMVSLAVLYVLLGAEFIAAAPRIARAMWAGEGLKWLWVVLAVWLALGVAEMVPLPFLLGMLAAQVGFWIGVAIFR